MRARVVAQLFYRHERNLPVFFFFLFFSLIRAEIFCAVTYEEMQLFTRIAEQQAKLTVNNVLSSTPCKEVPTPTLDVAYVDCSPAGDCVIP